MNNEDIKNVSASGNEQDIRNISSSGNDSAPKNNSAPKKDSAPKSDGYLPVAEYHVPKKDSAPKNDSLNGNDLAIEMDNVSRTFGDVKAVDELNLSLRKGEIMGFLGTNGAGKTTTIKMLIGLLNPSSGNVRIFGEDPAVSKTRLRIGYMPEIAYYYPFLNARELLEFYGGICGMGKKLVRERTEELLKAVDLEEAAKRPLKTYSKGMLQRAGIAQALLTDPDLLILDEPFTGLDPLARIRFRELLQNLRKRGKSIFFSSHELGETELLCDSVAIMKEGRCIYRGTVREIAGDGGTNLERLFLDVLKNGGIEMKNMKQKHLNPQV